MIINGYVNVALPAKVYRYTHVATASYDDFKIFASGIDTPIALYEGHLVSMDKLESYVTGITFVDEVEYSSLPLNIQYLLQKQSLRDYIVDKRIESMYHDSFFYPVGTAIPPKEVQLQEKLFINYGFEISLYKIKEQQYLLVDPKLTITTDGKTWSKEIVKGNRGFLSEHPLEYDKFLDIIQKTESILGESISISYDGGTFEYRLTERLNDDELGITGTEPQVSFGTGKSHTFPAAGIKVHSPWDANVSEESRPTEVKVAVMGTGNSRDILKQIRDGGTTGGYPFKGFEKVYKAKLVPIPWQDSFKMSEEEVMACQTRDAFISLIKEKARNLPSDCTVVVVELPDTVKELPFTGNIRSLIKIVLWDERKASQIILKSTKDKNVGLMIDNVALGIYVAAGGRPWILEQPMENTACIGISFGITEDKHKVVGIVEIFDGYGLSLGMRAREVKNITQREVKEKDLHLNTDDMVALVNDVIGAYADKYDGNHPEKLIIHKTTEFDSDESAALEKLTEFATEVNMVYVNTYGNGMHLINDNLSVAPTRLRYWQMEENKALLYTKSQETYDPHMPTPTLVDLQTKSTNSTYDIKQACVDIIKLTKLNWNSVVTYEREPVTISHSRKIVAMLRDGLALNNIPTDIRYFI